MNLVRPLTRKPVVSRQPAGTSGVVPGGVTSQLQDLSRQVFHDCRHVDWRTSANSLCIVSFPKEPVDPSHWELQSSPVGARLYLALRLSTLATARHFSS